MDPKVLFWTGALVNMALIVTLALFGVRARRRGDIAQHRRLMLSGAGLVGFFLTSYVFKLTFLGREDMSLWSPYAVWVLRFHETCVLVMLVAGSRGGRLEWIDHALLARCHRREGDAGAFAVALAQATGIVRPKVALLSATETASENMPSSRDALALAEWAADNIAEADVQGPLAFDNAISPASAETKGITGPALVEKDCSLTVTDYELGSKFNFS